MLNDKKILAIIPARSGSKRLQNKNLLDLNGKPLIAWTIEAGKKSRYIDELIVSTDSEEIAQVSKNYGAKVPFLRPKDLATDTATTTDVLIHAQNFLEDEYDVTYDYLLLLQPTSPLRSSETIDNAIEFFETKCADAVISVCESEHSPLWANVLPEDKSMINFLNESIQNTRSQDLPKYYRINGAFYMWKTQRFLSERTYILKSNIYAYIMSQEESIDIDTKLDFEIAEFLMQKKNSFYS